MNAVEPLMQDPPPTEDASIVAVEKFIHSTRDSGYRGSASALAELVDNALQAGATRIHIAIGASGGTEPLTVAILDNGTGMDAKTLRQALRFGGSSRFNDRAGMGRYGMGLPNSSLSQARRVDVYTWQHGGRVLSSYLDLDEISAARLTRVPVPRQSPLPVTCPEPPAETGTLVVWSRCDRLEHRRASTIARKLSGFLGRVFRHYLWQGVVLLVDGAPVTAVDPLFLHPKTATRGGKLYAQPMDYDVEVPDARGGAPNVGKVTVTFSELPVEKWHALPNEEKRRLGITKGAGVSVVRAGREIDYGWFFMGDKRRENYDDWWRCEVRFDPVLDELFGITHTKQQVRPHEKILEVLAEDLNATAKALNTRVRKAHLRLKARANFAESEKRATERDHLLPPLPGAGRPSPKKRSNAQGPAVAEQPARPLYEIKTETSADKTFFQPFLEDGRLILRLNPSHPFYKRIYEPLSEHDHPLAKGLRGQIELLLLAAARSEVVAARGKESELFKTYRTHWSDAIASFLSV